MILNHEICSNKHCAFDNNFVWLLFFSLPHTNCMRLSNAPRTQRRTKYMVHFSWLLYIHGCTFRQWNFNRNSFFLSLSRVIWILLLYGKHRSTAFVVIYSDLAYWYHECGRPEQTKVKSIDVMRFARVLFFAYTALNSLTLACNGCVHCIYIPDK